MKLIQKATIIANSTVVLLARVLRTEDGEPITQADVDTIDISILVNQNAGDTEVGAPLAEVAVTIFDTLQQDARWEENGKPVDREGYNVAIPIAGDYFPDADVSYG